MRLRALCSITATRALLLAVLLAGGCARKVRVLLPLSPDKAAELNGITGDRDADVTVAHAHQVPAAIAKAVKIDPSTTQWLERPSGSREWRPASAPTKDVESVLVRNRVLGALEGLGWGVLAGGTAGLVFNSVSSEHGRPTGLKPGWIAFAALAGGLIGVGFGATVADQTRIEFCPAR